MLNVLHSSCNILNVKYVAVSKGFVHDCWWAKKPILPHFKSTNMWAKELVTNLEVYREDSQNLHVIEVQSVETDSAGGCVLSVFYN